MKIRLLQEDLYKTLGTVGKVITGKAMLPILSNVLIEASKTGVSVCTTNLEIGIKVEMGAKVEEEGKITVPYKNLVEFVGSMGMGELSLDLDKDKLIVRQNKFSGKFATVDVSEFPKIAGFEESRSTNILSGLDVISVASEVAFAAAVDDSRPVWTGVKMEVDDDNLVVVATDGFRMSRKIINQKKTKKSIADTIILPAKTILELGRVASELKKEDIEMQIVEEGNQVVFRCGKVQIVSRVLEGNFPDVKKIIPNEFLTNLVLEREELLKAIKAVAIFARESSNVIKFVFSEGVVKVSALGGQTGEGEVEVEAQMEGEDGEVAFNFRFVMDFLQSTKDARVSLGVSGSSKAGVWKVEGREDYLHLIMPIKA